jgi:hypothetical protein
LLVLPFFYLIIVGMEGYCTWSHSMTHTHTPIVPLDRGSARCRNLYLTTHDIHKTQSHAPDGVRNRSASKQAAAQPRVRPHGPRHQPPEYKYHLKKRRLLRLLFVTPDRCASKYRK